jgi:NAD+ synthase
MNEIENVSEFLKDTFQRTGIESAVIAVSGGIDSAVSLSLLTRAVPKENIFPLLLPYGTQSMDDAELICSWNEIPAQNIQRIDIAPLVDQVAQTLQLNENEQVRRGNIMARVRMIAVFDRAKAKKALVVGTENKSEHFLGYFTRFGDGASDIEPIVHLYKTQVRKIAEELELPSIFLSKAPSAGLWQDQTDEKEMGFSYREADQVLEQLIDHGVPQSEINVPGVAPEIVDLVCRQVDQQSFKLEVPYGLEELK